MSHRALVAVARADGRFDVHLARDGAAERVLDRLLEPDASLPPGLLKGPSRGRARSLEDLLAAHLDPIEHEALLVVHRTGVVIPYVVIPYVVATADGLVEGNPRGAVVALVGHDGSVLPPAYVRGWVQGTADVLGEAVDRELLAPGEVVAWLSDAISRLAGEGHELATVPSRR